MIARYVNGDNLHKANEGIWVAMIKVPQNPVVIGAEFKICLLDQVVDSLFGGVTEPSGCAQDCLCDKAMKPADELLPSGELSRTSTTPRKFLNRNGGVDLQSFSVCVGILQNFLTGLDRILW